MEMKKSAQSLGIDLCSMAACSIAKKRRFAGYASLSGYRRQGATDLPTYERQGAVDLPPQFVRQGAGDLRRGLRVVVDVFDSSTFLRSFRLLCLPVTLPPRGRGCSTRSLVAMW